MPGALESIGARSRRVVSAWCGREMIYLQKKKNVRAHIVICENRPQVRGFPTQKGSPSAASTNGLARDLPYGSLLNSGGN